MWRFTNTDNSSLDPSQSSYQYAYGPRFRSVMTSGGGDES